MRCIFSGHCVSKESYCDGIADCPDSTDEPENCSVFCASFLKITSPHLICDGIFHCLDRSDENPNICQCNENQFKCIR